MDKLPNMMNVLYIDTKGKKPIVKQIPIPQPQSGQVLIKVECAPINPSDIMFLNSEWERPTNYPIVPGFEGVGTVLISGGGLLGWQLQGKRVAFISFTQFGSYAEYSIAPATSCIELEQTQAPTFMINPLTAVGMHDVASKAQAIVQTAACSQLGRMVQRYFALNTIPVINIVRREEQVEILKKEGIQFVLNQNDPEFIQKLRQLCIALNATVCFDALGGPLTGKILECMPFESTAYVHGCLSNEMVSEIPLGDLIFRNKSVEGFSFWDWFQSNSLVTQQLNLRKIKQLLPSFFKTTISKEFALEEFNEAIEYYQKNMTQGKVVICSKKQNK